MMVLERLENVKTYWEQYLDGLRPISDVFRVLSDLFFCIAMEQEKVEGRNEISWPV